MTALNKPGKSEWTSNCQNNKPSKSYEWKYLNIKSEKCSISFVIVLS